VLVARLPLSALLFGNDFFSTHARRQVNEGVIFHDISFSILGDNVGIGSDFGARIIVPVKGLILDVHSRP